MLPAATAAEILASDENLSVIFRIIQNKIASFFSGIIIPPVAKKILAESFPRRGLQKPSWNNLIGINVLHLKRYR
jgi:hypothetical protein